MKTIITQEDIQLRPLTREDARQVVDYANNKRVSGNVKDSFPYPYTIKDADFFYESTKANPDLIVFSIHYKGKPVGNIGVEREGDVYRYRAEIGMFIGEPFWNKGIGSKVIPLFCKYLFEHTDLVRIYATIFAFNTASIKMIEKCGFEFEGIAKKAVFKSGKFWDEYRYALIKD